MKRTLSIMLAVVFAVCALTAMPAQAQETSSRLVRQMYNGNWPSDKEAQQLRDDL